MSTEERITLYKAWLNGWHSVTEKDPPAFITEPLTEKLDFLVPLLAIDGSAAQVQAYELGLQNAQAAFEPNSRIW